MDLLEYQAKELFRETGIPVLPSQRIDRPKDLKRLTIPYPVVLKSQVYIGGRGKIGGVRFVENTIDAIAAAQTIFNLPIMGEYPKALLAEAKYNADREFYLAVVLNRSLRRPVLLGSVQGGIDVQAAMDQMQHVIVDQEFSPYYARRLAIRMGLKGSLISSVSGVIEQMYQLFEQYDLDMVEINPLGVSATGEVMALDGKVTVNDDALARHPTLAPFSAGRSTDRTNVPFAMEADGQIGVLCNGAGLTMATIDMLYQAGGKPANFLNIGGETRWENSSTSLLQRFQAGLEAMITLKLRVLLINVISTLVTCDETAQVIASLVKQRPSRSRTTNNALPADHTVPSLSRLPYFVVRLDGGECDRAAELLQEVQVPFFQSLDEAVLETVKLAKSNRHV